MKSQITHTSYVMDFLDIDFTANELSRVLEKETDHLLKKLWNNGFDDWILEFQAIYRNIDRVAVFRKNRSYDKRKGITYMFLFHRTY